MAKIYKCFIASPDDTLKERDVVTKVFERINRTIGQLFNFRLEPLTYEKDSHPGRGEDGDIQSLINKHIGNKYEIFIGVMHQKFGHPTSKAGSGTEEEFNNAFKRVENKDDIVIMFYFNIEPPKTIIEINTEQLSMVNEFRAKLERLGFRYSKYDGVNDFQEQLFNHLHLYFTKKYETDGNKSYNHTVTDNAKPKQFEIFSDFETVKPSIEKDVAGKLRKVTQALDNIIDDFSPVFRFNKSSDVRDQPILDNIKKHVNSVVPDVIFDSGYEGEINRWGIRHVIFRVETAVTLMLALEENAPGYLKKIGIEIGTTASDDLFKNIINRKNAPKIIPDSMKAFIQLLNYWDSSGGWGHIEHVDEQTEGESPGKWKFVVRRNFLANKSDEKKEKILYEFWKGYIKGALDKALRLLSQMYYDLPPEERKKVILPPFTKILDVDEEPENDTNTDAFVVTFITHQYGWAIKILASCKSQANDPEGAIIDVNYILSQLSYILNTLSGENSILYDRLLSELNQKDREEAEHISSHKLHKVNFDLTHSIEIVNSLVQDFSRGN